MAWTTAAVALILGAVGMLNTMLMSIFERTREIGILRAVGWRRRRVLALILGEALAHRPGRHVARRRAGRRRPAGRDALPHRAGLHRPEHPPRGPGIALAMGVGLSLLGGLYPGGARRRPRPDRGPPL